MHSRIFVLSLADKGVKSPSFNPDGFEFQLAEYFVPSHADYVCTQDKGLWSSDISWLCQSHLSPFCEFVSRSESSDRFLVLKSDKAKDYLSHRFSLFKEKVDALTFDDFRNLFSSLMYEVETILRDESGFWIVFVGSDGSWDVYPLDDFIRYVYGSPNPQDHKYKVETILDYHF